VIPIVPPPELASVDQSLRIPDRDGGPLLMWQLGRDANGKRLAAILFERPQQIRARRTKEMTEEQHLERFLVDWRNGVGPPPFETHRRGSEPPDFFVTREGVEAGLDVTQFVLRDRVEAYATFRELCEEALRRGPRRFRRLRGQIVYLGMTQHNQRRLKRRIGDVVDVLEQLDPPPTPMWEADDAGGATALFDGGALIAGPLQRAATGTFYGFMGFELAFAYSSVAYADVAWAALQRLVSRHDNSLTKTLVVSVGAPIFDGFAYPSDGAVAFLALAHANDGNALVARHIEEVYVHVWFARAIHRLVPGTAGQECLYEEWPFDAALEPYRFYVAG
jgi:hypothetical protein